MDFHFGNWARVRSHLHRVGLGHLHTPWHLLLNEMVGVEVVRPNKTRRKRDRTRS